MSRLSYARRSLGVAVSSLSLLCASFGFSMAHATTDVLADTPQVAISDFPPAPVTPGRGGNLEATAKLSNCSGSFVRFTSSKPEHKALFLTNGHCMSKAVAVGEVLVNQPTRMSMQILNRQGQRALDVTASSLLYGTMDKTDVALYESTSTYAEITAKTKFEPFTISLTPAAVGDKVFVPSSYWKLIYECDVDKIVYKLKEDGHVWPGAMRYGPSAEQKCSLKGGTSGSPIVSRATGQIVGINNTGDDGGPLCGNMGPCEEDESGKITRGVKEGYGTRLEWFYTCLVPETNKLDLNLSGCQLSKPKS